MRNERNQVGGSSGSASALAAGASGSSVNIGTSNADGGLGGRSGSAGGAGGSGSAGPAAANASTDRDSFSRWRDRQYYGAKRWFQSSRDDSQWDKNDGKLLKLYLKEKLIIDCAVKPWYLQIPDSDVFYIQYDYFLITIN